MFRTHEKFVNNPIGFAGGIWTWSGYAPNLLYSLDSTEAAMRSIQEHPVDTILFTMWGDNGNDCSKFTALPALFAAAEMAQGNFNRADISQKFEAYTGYTFDEFMALELPNLTGKIESHRQNPGKYLLFNDPLLGILDFTVSDELPGLYAASAQKLAASVNGRKYDYLFDFMAKLVDVLSIKCDFGIRLRKAYHEQNKEVLHRFAGEEIPMLIDKVEDLYMAFRALWLTENKGFGLEVQENRFGGLLLRLKSCRIRIQDLLAGKIAGIEELDAEQKVFIEGCEGKRVEFNCFAVTYTAGAH